MKFILGDEFIFYTSSMYEICLHVYIVTGLGFLLSYRISDNVLWILNHKAEYHVFVICNEFVNKNWLEGFPLNVTCVIVHFDIKQSWQFLLACDLSFCQFILTYIAHFFLLMATQIKIGLVDSKTSFQSTFLHCINSKENYNILMNLNDPKSS